MRNAAVDVFIDELRLDGRFTREEGMRLAGSLEIELTRLFSEYGIPITLRTDHRIESICSSIVEVNPVSQSKRLGTVLGRTIYEGLGGSLRHLGNSGASRPEDYE